MQNWYIYILKCSDGSFYTGITTDLGERIKRHNLGDGAKYTRTRRPVSLIYSERFNSKSEAKRREIEIKSFSRKNKERLIKGSGFPDTIILGSMTSGSRPILLNDWVGTNPTSPT